MMNNIEDVQRFFNSDTNSYVLGTSALSVDKEDQFYDTTILVISENPTYIQDGVPLYTGRVSWSNHDDCIKINGNGQLNSPRAQDYKEVLLEIDIDKFWNDNSYRYALLTSLLDQKRVLERLEYGLEDSPEKPCGNYMGGIFFNQDTRLYQKYDRPNIASKVHNSPVAKNRRAAYKEKQIQIKESQLANIYRQIEALKAQAQEIEGEIQNLNGNGQTALANSDNNFFTPGRDIR